MQYKWMVAILGLAMIAGTVGVVSAEAQDGGARQPLVSKIAQRFNLKEEDVQAVFDEVTTERQNAMETKVADRLSQAVSGGKLTEAQKQLIVAKRQELQQARQTQREQFAKMTPEERQTAMKNQQADLKAWATANGIDFHYLMPARLRLGGTHRGHPGFGDPAEVG